MGRVKGRVSNVSVVMIMEGRDCIGFSFQGVHRGDQFGVALVDAGLSYIGVTVTGGVIVCGLVGCCCGVVILVRSGEAGAISSQRWRFSSLTLGLYFK